MSQAKRQSDSQANPWVKYYQKQQGRAPRKLLLDALALYPSQPAEAPPRQAIDLGCGQGTETLALLEAGWQVLAIDRQPKALTLIQNQTPPEHQQNLTIQQGSFETLTLPPIDLLHASYSLPFCHPKAFDRFWQTLTQAIRPGGRLVGQLFGDSDSWANNSQMTFLTRQQAETLLAEQFELEYFHEQDEDGKATSGPKHWHVFTSSLARTDFASSSLNLLPRRDAFRCCV